jgi:hypothetical protein
MEGGVFMTHKKFYLVGVAVLLSVSLFVIGCETEDSGGSPPPKQPTPTPEEGLKGALGEAAVVDGDTVKLEKTTTLEKDVTVPAAVTLSISNGAALTIPEGKALTISSGATLSISNGATLTVTGELTGAAGEDAVPMAGVLAAAANSGGAAKIVVDVAADRATVGTVTGEGAKFYAVDSSPLTPVAAGVYEWDAAAGGVDTAGWKQTARDVSAIYTLLENETTDPTQSGISVVPALQDIASKEVTIKLTGTFGGEYVAVVDANHTGTFGEKWYTDIWGTAVSADLGTQVGVYGGVTIKGLFPAALESGHAINIKPYPALGFYKGVSETTEGPLASPTSSTQHYIPDDLTLRQKWVYVESRAQDAVFSVLLFNGGETVAQKTVTLDIAYWTAAGGTKTTDILKVTIDYSEVRFPAAATPGAGAGS